MFENNHEFFEFLVKKSEEYFPYVVPELIDIREEVHGDITELVQFCKWCGGTIIDNIHTCPEIYYLLWNTYVMHRDNDNITKAKKRLGF